MKIITKNNGQKFYPLRKLLTGLSRISVFFIIRYITGGANGLYRVESHLTNKTFNFLPHELAGVIGSLCMVVIGIFAVYCFISGMYRTFTFYQYIPTFEDNTPGGEPVKGCDSYPNINRVLNYRESKMCGMSSDRAAELYVGSSKIESLYTGGNSGPETQRTLSYIESKLSGMSSDRGLNYLANKL